MKVLLAHFWYLKERGGEKVLKSVSNLFEEYDMLFHVHDQELVKKAFPNARKIRNTFISYLPFAKRLYQMYLFLFPLAIYAAKTDKYDLIISFESGPIKGLKKNKNQIEITYCHSPMRYLYDMKADYRTSYVKTIYLKVFSPFLKLWDSKSSKNLDLVISNSNFVADRVRAYWGRDSLVINPCLSDKQLQIKNDRINLKKNEFLLLGELTEYKKPKLAIDACIDAGAILHVVGDGEQKNSLTRKYSRHKNIIFYGRVPDKNLLSFFAKCNSLIFPGIEDYGLVPLESISLGLPVIAYKKGGCLDYLDEDYADFFNTQKVDEISKIIRQRMKKPKRINPKNIDAIKEEFTEKVFLRKFKQAILELGIKI